MKTKDEMSVTSNGSFFFDWYDEPLGVEKEPPAIPQPLDIALVKSSIEIGSAAFKKVTGRHLRSGVQSLLLVEYQKCW